MSGGSEVELLKWFVNTHRQIINIWEINSIPVGIPPIFSTWMQTNLYGWAMSQPLPTGGFKWVYVNPNEISELAIRTDRGYLLEVDVSYPKELHNPHNDLPFMCERMEINGVEKLVLNLRDKTNYVIHIQALNQVLRHGLRLDAMLNPSSDTIRSIAMVKDLYRL